MTGDNQVIPEKKNPRSEADHCLCSVLYMDAKEESIGGFGQKEKVL